MAQYGTTQYGRVPYGPSDNKGTVDEGFGASKFGVGPFGDDTTNPSFPIPTRAFGDDDFGVGGFGSVESTSPFFGGENGSFEQHVAGYDELPFGDGPFGGVEVQTEDVLPETAYFGGGRYGAGLYAFSNEQFVTVRNAWDSGGISLHDDSNAEKLITPLTTPLAFVSDDIQEINAAHHIHTAVGKELDHMAALVDIDRQSGESDDRFRMRIIAAFAAGITGTTHEDVLEFITTILQTSSERVNIDWLPSVPGTANVSVFEDDIQNAAITVDDLEQFATDAVPAGHKIIVELRGSFIFDGTDTDVPPERGLSGDGVEGGTLSESLN